MLTILTSQQCGKQRLPVGDMENEHLRRENKYILFAVSAVIIILLIGLQYIVQLENNKAQAYRTAEVLIDQVKNVLQNNERKEQILIDSIKEDYITRAKAISYIIDNNDRIEGSVRELDKVAKLILVDEIHLFNQRGEIYGGTVPEYYGFSFDSGEQMAYFKPMLKDRELAMCQDVTPNTAEGKAMMYAICWNDAGTRMVQVGIEPLRLLAELRSNEISEVIDDMPSYKGIDIVVADKDTLKIVASTTKQRHDTLYMPNDLKNNTATVRFDKYEDGRKYYCSASEYKKFIIAIIQDKRAVNENIGLSISITFAYLILAALFLYYVFRKLTAHISIEQKNANTDPMTGFFNRRAYETVIDEYRQKKPEDNFVYISMDLNGLKQINDSGGHCEGDRLIAIAGQCMQRCFSDFGRIFRIGGDEFVAMIFDEDEHVEELKEEFERVMKEESERNRIPVSVSCGYVKLSEFPDKNIDEIAKIADQRLYEAKTDYYRLHERRKTR